MNPFADLLNDDFYVQDKNNSKNGPYKTAFSKKNEITVFDENLDIEENDQIIRPLPNGKEEVYYVEEVNFIRGLHGIPSSYQIKLRKSTAKPKEEFNKATTIHITNSHGFQVGDHNTQNITNSFNELIQRINSSDVDVTQKEKAKKDLKNLLENPTVASILGGAVSGLIALLS